MNPLDKLSGAAQAVVCYRFLLVTVGAVEGYYNEEIKVKNAIVEMIQAAENRYKKGERHIIPNVEPGSEEYMLNLVILTHRSMAPPSYDKNN